jgi:serine/threonine protein phosphatase PrpC
VVCDGSGGSSGGARAAELVICEVVCRAEHASVHELERLMLGMDAALVAEPGAGETTCVALWVTPREIYGVSTGDSEAWWVGDDAAVELTAGQTRGRLGTGINHASTFRRLREGGRVLVGTDGFFAFTPPERRLGVVRTAPAADVARRLVREARLPSGRLHDDTTVVVVSR